MVYSSLSLLICTFGFIFIIGYSTLSSSPNHVVTQHNQLVDPLSVAIVFIQTGLFFVLSQICFTRYMNLGKSQNVNKSFLL